LNSLSARFQSGPLGKNPATAAYFFPNGKALAVGDRRTNPEFAATLRAVAKDGPAAFYSGAIAENIVNAVHAGDIQGDLSLKDLAAYRVLQKPGIGPFRDYKICSAPPSSSGVAMNQIMSLYDLISTASPDGTPEANLRTSFSPSSSAMPTAITMSPIRDAVTVPVADLLNPTYLKSRASSGFKPGDAPQPGDLVAVLHNKPIIDMWGRDTNAATPCTTHLSFVDFEGNAVSFTATVESGFGSQRWTNGFLLNNQLTDFTRPPTSVERWSPTRRAGQAPALLHVAHHRVRQER